jgi:Histidine kinase-, DNA gyrase B-, and HSP90-like ATPase
MSNSSGQLNISDAPGGDDWSPIFGDDFLPRLVGAIMKDPEFAIVELVANCWDAGASKVDVTWPTSEGQEFCIEDNGESMAMQEFQRRWLDLTYNRTKDQPSTVSISQKQSRKRRVFGCNGVGRHAMFCFCDEYLMEIKKDGKRVVASVKRGSGKTPFSIEIIEESLTTKHGTKIWCSATKNVSSLTSRQISDHIGSRFIADPEFETYINRELIQFEDLTAFSEKLEVTLDNGELIVVTRFDTEKTNRTSKQHGIAYWVDNKLVGNIGWDGFDGTLLDGRHTEAKRYTYVVDASPVGKQSVKQDWSGFHASPLVNDLKKRVSFAIREDLKGLTKELRERNKKSALNANKGVISKLPLVTRHHISEFIEEVQLSCPSIMIKDLENMVGVLANLEKTKTGYSLLDKIHDLNIDDLDSLNSILDEWSVNDAQKVLYEIEWRIKLVLQMESLIHIKTVDELHQLQPLFDRGLWILGHEYDSIDFSSNRELSTVLRNLFAQEQITRIRKRPDFVIIPTESALSVFAREDVLNPGEDKVKSLQTVVIVELKRPGIPISTEQVDQTRAYAREIKKNVPLTTRINCYVLGTSIDASIADGSREGNINIYPTEYTLILAQAKRRLFKLRDKISSFDEVSSYFDEISSRLSLDNSQMELLEEGENNTGLS